VSKAERGWRSYTYSTEEQEDGTWAAWVNQKKELRIEGAETRKLALKEIKGFLREFLADVGQYGLPDEPDSDEAAA
jgi:hypothetical protein